MWRLRPVWTLVASVGFRCLCSTPGRISELWHLNWGSDLGPNSTSGVPQGTTAAVSTMQDVKMSGEPLWHVAKTEGIQWQVVWKPSLGVPWLGLRSGMLVAQPIFWPRFDDFMVWAAGSLTYPGWRATSLAQTEPDWRSARVRFNETEATPKAGIFVLTSEHLCHTVSVMRAKLAPKQPLFL